MPVIEDFDSDASQYRRSNSRHLNMTG